MYNREIKEKVKKLVCDGRNIDTRSLDFEKTLNPPVLNDADIKIKEHKQGCGIMVSLEVNETVRAGRLAILLENEKKRGRTPLPSVQLALDGRDLKGEFEKQKRSWLWILLDLPTGRHRYDIVLSSGKTQEMWSGKISVWIIAEQEYPAKTLSFDLFETVSLPPMPPRPRSSRILKQVINLKELNIGEKRFKGDK